MKVGDFGLVTEMNDCNASDTKTTNPMLLKSYTKDAGTYLYMSPEQINGKKYNLKVDIYSLGMIFFELLVSFSTEMERFKTLTNLRNNYFPDDFAEKYSKEHKLLKLMLSENPNFRPTTSEIKLDV